MMAIADPMVSWPELPGQIESLDGVNLDARFVTELQHCHLRQGSPAGPITFCTPSFKAYATSEISACGKSAWPAVSVTGSDCKLQCDHCKAKILESMIPARTPEALWRVACEQIERGARGLLLTGGSNHRNEV